MMFFLFLCEHSQDPPARNFVIFQHCHHHFQCIETDIQLHTQFPDCILLICGDKLIEMLFILWCDSCVWLFRAQLVFLITITTDETHHSLPDSAHILCFVSMSNQKTLMNVSGYIFFLIFIFSAWRNSVTHLCFIFISMSDTILSDCILATICHTATKCNEILAQKSNIYYHIRTFSFDTMGQHNKIGGIAFTAVFMCSY